MTGSFTSDGYPGGVASTVLADLTRRGEDRNRMTITEALHEIGRSGFGFVMLVLALPALTPIPGPRPCVRFGTGDRRLVVLLRGKKPLASICHPKPQDSKQAFAGKRYADPIVGRLNGWFGRVV
ncbi:Exopolysaccharide synthesis ExoD [Rhizobium sp. CF080]|uniref:exopolysaccharide biosynthesis protein n=1 Tax=Rhizobium sp. (strain CF080) TaxID=1144310 RepID=UPI000271A39A|nr:exopolysaccharide biosynthesis protein [Rhizobium sp. CF080]EUB98091.1 Exopolysaccharide synthesis ExoD [Rhizobium sp. CF080]